MERKTAIIAGGMLLMFVLLMGTVVARHLVRTTPALARKANGPLPVQVAEAKQVDLAEIIGANGVIQPIALVNLTARMAGQVESIHADIGDLVKPQDILAQFRQELPEAALRTAESVKDRASGDLNRAATNLRRMKAVSSRSLLPRTELEKAQAMVDEARVILREAEEKLLLARSDLKNATLVSPVSGIVMEREVDAGEAPSLGDELFTIGRIDQVLVETKIAEERVGEIQLQQLAAVTFSAFPNEVFDGKVVRIKPQTDPETRSFLVYVKVENPDLKLKPGLSSFVRIKKAQRVLAVPSIALINPTGVEESAVFIVEKDSHARLQRVKVGTATEGMTQIREGIREGDRVVVVGQLNLRHGDKVRVGDEFNGIVPGIARKDAPESKLLQARH